VPVQFSFSKLTTSKATSWQTTTRKPLKKTKKKKKSMMIARCRKPKQKTPIYKTRTSTVG
jgi:hypothetical protein